MIIIKTDLEKFANWLELEEFRSTGYNLWASNKYSYWKEASYYNTQQLVELYLKNKK